MSGAYYNEFDPQAAAWIRELIKAGLVAPGEVDERSIEDVCPADLRGFTQVHMFAGIAGWSAALRRAGIPDSQRVWTGSAPCQPFSSAGEGAGFADERHLWPAFHHHIAERRPPVVFGEQVASKAADTWVDLVHADLEALGYAFGCVPFPSSSCGAPHIRDRNYWVTFDGRLGDTNLARLEGFGSRHQAALGLGQGAVRSAAAPGEPDGPADSDSLRQQPLSVGELHDAKRHAESRSSARWLADPCGGRRAEGRPWAERCVPDAGGASGGLADADSQQRSGGQSGVGHEHEAGGWLEGAAEAAGLRGDLRPGPTNGFWSDADWLSCRDAKWRPVEPGTFPLAHGLPARVGRLRGYGNAINVEAAKAFIEAYYGSR